MKRILLSDAHLTGRDDPNQALLAAFLEQVEADEVYFLGDMFHFWWGHEGYRDPDYGLFFEAIEALINRDCKVFWVRGNHDFHLGPVIEKELGVVVGDAFEVEFQSQRGLLVHGDEADRTLGYRAVRAVVRGRAFAGLMNALGPRRSRRVGLALAGASRHEMTPNAPLLKAQANWAEERFEEGHRFVVLGHSHCPGIHRLNGGTLVNLGDFADAHSYLELDESLRLCRWKSGESHTIQEERVL